MNSVGNKKSYFIKQPETKKENIIQLLMLPPEIINHIGGFLDSKSLAQFELTCKAVYEAIDTAAWKGVTRDLKIGLNDETFDSKHDFKLVVKYRKIPEKIREIFGNLRSIAKLPELDLNGKVSDYIDFITVEMMTHPIMRGQDKFKRHFIAIHCKTLLPTFINTHDHVFAIFQRRTGDPSDWRGAGGVGTFSKEIELWDTTGLKKENLANLKTLVSTGSCTLSKNTVTLAQQENAALEEEILEKTDENR